MENFDWYHQIKFLESVSNLKSAIEKSNKRKPNTEVANGIVVCLQQGRMFFQSAKNAPLEIRPLLTFYGMIGFAKGLILARNLGKIEGLKQSHGLKDISSKNSRIHEIELKVHTSGTFQEFNDVVCQTGKVELWEDFYGEYNFGALYDRSETLKDLQANLKDILSRLLNLAPLYKDTFQEDSNILEIRLENSKTSGVKEFIVPFYSDKLNNDLQSLMQFVTELRDKYPFLKNWCFEYVTQSPHPMDVDGHDKMSQ